MINADKIQHVAKMMVAQRQCRGMTIAESAARIGIPADVCAAYESGTLSRLDWDVLSKVERAYSTFIFGQIPTVTVHADWHIFAYPCGHGVIETVGDTTMCIVCGKTYNLGDDA